MKNLFLKTLVIGLILLVMPNNFMGQQINNHIIELELEKIENPDLRYCILAHIANDSNYQYTIDEDNNSVLLFSTEHWNDSQFQTYFDQTMAQIQSEFDAYIHAAKERQGEKFTDWKSSMPQDFFVLLFRLMLIENPNNRDGNQHCIDSDPFCTTDIVTFHVDGSASGVCEPGPNYGCMSSYTDRPPFWFHMKIGVAGTFTIRITNSNNLDLDFCAWGPFSDPITPCPNQLTNNKIIDCDSPYNTVQECTIPNSAQVGQYYIMVITKYSAGSTDITFQKVASSGPGETDCGILPPLVENGGPYCVGDNIQLSGNAQAGATYSWSGPGGWTATGHTVNRPNCTMAMAGTYTCTISLNGQTNSAGTEVQVYPKPTANFTASPVCLGGTTQFSNTSTTNPPNQTMNCQWDFGDGQTSTQPNPTHQFATAGNHNVTLTVSCGDGTCTSTKTQAVTVYETPVANAGEDQTVQYGGIAQLHGSGGTGSFLYHWEPENKVANPNAQNTQTVGLTESTTFTLTVTQPQGGCSSTDQVSVLVNGSNMTATASATPNSICNGGSAQLSARAVGGNAGNYTYSWSPSLGLSNPIIATPIASPTTTTTYTCTVSDGYTTQQVSATVTVNQPEYSEVTEYICPGESYNFYGTNYTNAGNYDYVTTTAQGCEKIITLHLRHYPSYSNAHTTTEAICYGTSYNFHGQYFNTEGLYSVNLHTIHGCDSIVWLDLTVYPPNDTLIVDPTICISQTYNFHGTEYSHDGDIAYFDTIDNHGCLKVEKLILSVGAYQMPPTQEEYQCYAYNETPSFYWDKTGLTYTQDTYDEIILPDPSGGCDIKYRLDLKFHQNFHQEDNIVACDAYTWNIDHNTYEQGGTYTYPNNYVMGGFDCPGEYVLNLTINDSNEQHDQATACNEYTWVYGIDQQTITYDEGGHYEQFTETAQGCELLSTLDLNLDYTPSFSKVWGKPWVVGGSEFQYTIENYWLTLDHPRSMHETTWELFDSEGKPFNKWDILPYDDGDKCYLYIYTFETDSVRLHVHTYSTNETCNCGEDEKDLWIHCGYHSVNETIDPSSVDIFPNPNSGNMTLSFDNLLGETLVKVYNITGTLIDQFTLHNEFGHQTYDYNADKLSPGIYFFNIINKKGILTKKVIIID